jgi:uncharacterized protein (DUF1499 family)
MRDARQILLNAAVVLAVLTLIAAVASGPGARMDIWGFGTGFVILRWSAYIAVAAFGLAFVLFLTALIRRGAGGRRILDLRYAVVLVLCALVVGVPYTASLQFKRYPTLADATTNTTDPPRFDALIPAREKTADNPAEYRGGEAAEVQRQYFPGLDSLRTSLPPAEVIGHAESVARRMGLDIAVVLPGAGRLEATDTTFWYGFKDDLVVRARRPDEVGATQVDIRSASRVGYLDGGVNAKRVKRFRQLLARALNGEDG